ncbi:hypothetical protein O181_114296 [Austropuccinia psidii MF-1]|uniref:Uncharacterized protein n=1 Tax=Austropuccinia psidii MF-1 TaxID=1389203 RepID=A0A9Q3PV75_9BASI|nr:hypothetical protein [Austropuccinia psidii MF-1]
MIPSISLPTSVTPFSGSIIAWPQSNNPLPMANGHHSPPSLVESFVSQPSATSINNHVFESISISTKTDFNPSSELQKFFDVSNHLFHCYCHYFYDYV